MTDRHHDQTGSPGPTGPTRTQQAAAWLAYLTLAAAVVYLLVAAARRWEVLLLGTASLAVLVVAGWFAVSRRGRTRVLALVVAAAAVASFAALMLTNHAVRVLVVGLLLTAASAAAARVALSPRPADPSAAPTALPAEHAVLIMNPKSGGGKVERFELERRCRERGIEPVVLVPGSDLLAIAEDAVRRGADVIGMAGGDGSQALVASVASRHRIPFVVVPAGTRNHFALDLGLDRADVVGALDAFEEGVDTLIDLAEVNGRVFVNNASMGLYARIVQSDAYRDAKVHTAADTLPDLIGPDAAPLDLRFTLPSGEQATSADLVLVSNNPYQLSHLRGAATRPRLDGGGLGIVTVLVGGALDAERFAALEAAGQVRRFRGWNEWTAPDFEVTSAGPVEVGVDGEALTMEPPLRFSIRPGALTVRVTRAVLSRTPAPAVHVTSAPTLVALRSTALGRPAVSS
ncbi:MAG TPA: diacylglycerol kinase family protein [Ornithinibacter sp.]|nr:diacylglycerol kinase family protein [Ornithinibacter sp.]